MPIQTIAERVRAPIIGVIRLGVKEEAKSGSLYPSSKEYFILKDAPGVKEVYGEDPTELDITFSSNDIEEIIPTWLKWYASGGSDGTGGKLMCYGNGPDSSGNPGEASFMAKKDPITKIVPVRPCLGDKCPDWLNQKGQQQCKPTMRVLCMLPRVSLYGVFRIDTGSWRSIGNFHNQLKWIQSWNNGQIRALPLKIVREKTSIPFFNVAKQKQETKDHYIMYLKPNEDFSRRFGEDIQRKIESTFSNSNFSLPSARDVLEAPMEDHFREEASSLPPVDFAKLAEQMVDTDADLIAAFAKLEEVTGQAIPKKNRILGVRSKETEADVKGAVLKAIVEKITAAEEKNKKSQGTVASII
jgi:hypothetical protein